MFSFSDLGGIRPRLVYSRNSGQRVERIGRWTHADGIADRQAELACELPFDGDIGDLGGGDSEGCGAQGQPQKPLALPA